VPCSVDLRAGWTYSIFTDCKSVQGDTQLRLLDDKGVEVAFNEYVGRRAVLMSRSLRCAEVLDISTIRPVHTFCFAPPALTRAPIVVSPSALATRPRPWWSSSCNAKPM
jgi:hypothetical protein